MVSSSRCSEAWRRRASSARNRSRSGAEAWANTSSSWSTTSSSRRPGGGGPASAPASAPIGSAPGRSDRTSQPSAGSRGSRPAKTSEVLPDPDGPITITRSWWRSRRVRSSTSLARPKNSSACASPKATIPGYGHGIRSAGGGEVGRWRCSRRRATPAGWRSGWVQSTGVRKSSRSGSSAALQEQWHQPAVAGQDPGVGGQQLAQLRPGIAQECRAQDQDDHPGAPARPRSISGDPGGRRG